MRKQILILVIVVLMFGVVSATVISNMDELILPVSSVYGGDSFGADFSFDYFDAFGNAGNSPLVIRLAIESNDSAFPVWLGDFEVSGYVDKSWIGGFFDRRVFFECSEDNDFGVEVLAGTFYCYDEDGYLDVGEHDDVHLDIVSESNIWPGEYELNVRLFYLEDEDAPVVEILNVVDFDRYYRESDNVEVLAGIVEMNLDETWGNVYLGLENMTVPYVYFDEGIYHYSRLLPIDIEEGDYPLGIFARDLMGLEGSDFVTLKIDRSAPVVVLVEPSGVVSEVMEIVVNVTDEKAGLDNESVMYRLREVVGFSPCPGDGVGSFTCYNSGWLNLDWEGGDLFGVDVNTTEIGLNGDYWLEIRASDVLGNMGVLE